MTHRAIQSHFTVRLCWQQLQEGLLSAVSSSFGTNAINSLISLGITATSSDDGSISLDADTLSSALNSNFHRLYRSFRMRIAFVGHSRIPQCSRQQQRNDGAISLALSEDSSEETTLNADVTNQQALIATQTTNLTTELNAANQVLQEIPEQIQEVSEMYSAVTGYNGNQNG